MILMRIEWQSPTNGENSVEQLVNFGVIGDGYTGFRGGVGFNIGDCCGYS